MGCYSSNIQVHEDNIGDPCTLSGDSFLPPPSPLPPRCLSANAPKTFSNPNHAVARSPKLQPMVPIGIAGPQTSTNPANQCLDPNTVRLLRRNTRRSLKRSASRIHGGRRVSKAHTHQWVQEHPVEGLVSSVWEGKVGRASVGGVLKGRAERGACLRRRRRRACTGRERAWEPS